MTVHCLTKKASRISRRGPAPGNWSTIQKGNSMKITGQRIAAALILIFIVLALFRCNSVYTALPAITPTPPDQAALAPIIVELPNPDAAFAQATIDTGQGQLLDLSRKATEISLNITQADATQEFIVQQTQAAMDVTTPTQSTAAAATQSAILVKASQTAQAHAFLDARSSQTAQAVAALKAYPLTATPYAKTQAALLMQQYNREQQSFEDRVAAPLIPILAILDFLLVILGIVLGYRQFMSRPGPRPLLSAGINAKSSPLIMIEGVIAEHNPWLHRNIPSQLPPAIPPRLPGDTSVNMEIDDPAEPPYAH
jgi:uncharacterized membrane protein